MVGLRQGRNLATGFFVSESSENPGGTESHSPKKDVGE